MTSKGVTLKDEQGNKTFTPTQCMMRALWLNAF